MPVQKLQTKIAKLDKEIAACEEQLGNLKTQRSQLKTQLQQTKRAIKNGEAVPEPQSLTGLLTTKLADMLGANSTGASS